MLFVAKVIYLLHPEGENTENHHEEKNNESVEQEASGDEEDANNEKEEEKGATLMWLMRKLSILAKKEAAHTPKNPLKVSQACIVYSGLQIFIKQYEEVHHFHIYDHMYIFIYIVLSKWARPDQSMVKTVC